MRNLSKLAKLTLILLAVMVGCFLIAGVLLVSEYGKDNFAGLGSHLQSKNAVNIDEEKTAAVSGINNISVETASEDINFLVSDSSDVKAHFYGYYNTSSKDYKPELTVASDGGALKIKIEYKPNISVMMFSSNLKLDVYLPASYANALDIHSASGSVNLETVKKLTGLTCHTASGDIKVDSLNSDRAELGAASGRINIGGTYGIVNCKTASGDVIITDLKASSAGANTASGMIKGKVTADDLKLETTSGDITIDPVDTKNCKAGTTSGRITLYGTPGSLNAGSTSGDIRLKVDKLDANINVKTFSGSTEIKLPQDAGFQLDYSTFSGSGRCDFPITISGTEQRNNISGTVGSGSSRITVNSTSGDLRVIK